MYTEILERSQGKEGHSETQTGPTGQAAVGCHYKIAGLFNPNEMKKINFVVYNN